MTIRSIAAVAALLSITSAAVAADMPVAAPIAKASYVAPLLFSWTGCYVGASAGGNWGNARHVAQTPPFTGVPLTNNVALSGGIAGGTIGCNYQVSNVVIGIENDISWTNKQGSGFNVPPFEVTTRTTTRERWIDTLRGRVGFAMDRFMIYGTAGAAFAGTDITVTNPAFGTVTNAQTRTGWTAGVGGEWAAFTQPWGDVTFKLEYLHVDFGNQQYVNPPVNLGVATIVTRNVRLTDDIVRAGVNVKFNWGGPVIARY